MGKDSGSWIHRQHSPWKSPNLNYTGITPMDSGGQNGKSGLFSSYANPCLYTASAHRVVPGFASRESVTVVPGFASRESVRANEVQVGYYSYQNPGFNLTRNTIIDKRFYVPPCEFSKAIPDSTPSKFLGYDQSGEKTRLNCSSVGHPNRLNVELPKEIAPIFQPLHVIPNAYANGSGEKGSEMHEDTEELDALLCSDSEEETSTGHSPSEIGFGFERKEQRSEMQEEVASSATPNKRRRLDGEGDKSLIDTASSAEAHDKRHGYDDGTDKESSLDYKRMRKERIKKTLCVLQRVIPGGKGKWKGKDAVMVIDEAIRYLRSLQMKANALGAAL